MSLVLTVIGDDKPGLVGRLSEVVANHDGNWLESRLVRLAGKFAGVLRVEVPEDKRQELRRSLTELAGEGIRIGCEDASALSDGLAHVRLEIVGTDRPGIVRHISGVLAQREVNVAELHTVLAEAPMAGQPLFRATVDLHVPTTVDIAELRHALESMASDIMVDVKLDNDGN